MDIPEPRLLVDRRWGGLFHWIQVGQTQVLTPGTFLLHVKCPCTYLFPEESIHSKFSFPLFDLLLVDNRILLNCSDFLPVFVRANISLVHQITLFAVLLHGDV
jgi:hypothetical protein